MGFHPLLKVGISQLRVTELIQLARFFDNLQNRHLGKGAALIEAQDYLRTPPT